MQERAIDISGAVHVKMLGANSTRPMKSKKTDERVKEDYPFLYGKSIVFYRFFKFRRGYSAFDS